MPAPSGIAGYWFRRGDGGLVWETEVGSKQPRSLPKQQTSRPIKTLALRERGTHLNLLLCHKGKLIRYFEDENYYCGLAGAELNVYSLSSGWAEAE